MYDAWHTAGSSHLGPPSRTWPVPSQGQVISRDNPFPTPSLWETQLRVEQRQDPGEAGASFGEGPALGPRPFLHIPG